jgi:hypothetical protein
MLVVIAVSSRNTSRAGSSRPCSRIQRRRARTTSARSRSAACRLFFKRDLVPLEKTRQRAAAGSNPMPSQLCDGFYQSQVRLFGNHGQYAVRQFFQGRNATSSWLRGGAPGFLPALHPLNDRAHTDPEMLGGLTPRRTCFNGLDNAFAQVTGVRFRHRYPPAMESMLKDSLIHSSLGIPRFKSAGSRFSVYAPRLPLTSRLNGCVAAVDQ